MEGFIDKLARELIEGGELHRKTVVFPNRRPALFLEKKLNELSDGPVIAPRIFSVTDFFGYLTGREPAEKYDLLLSLFEVYGQVAQRAGLEPHTFEQFIGWGHILLNDFDEIDKFLVSPEKILQYLKEIKAIEQWEPGEDNRSQQMNDYLKFFELLPEIYRRFKEKLNSQHKAYDGMIYREAVETYDRWKNKFGREEIYLAGFNALTKSEEKIFERLIQEKKAKIFWDADRFYLDEPFEAGLFLRRNRDSKKFGDEFNWVFDAFREPKKIRIVQTTDELSQVQFTVNQLLELEKANPENKKEFRLKTLVVLNDPAMFNELLYALPDELEEVNLTFSLPVERMQTGSFIDHYIRFYSDLERNKNVNLKDFLYLASHPYFIPQGENIKSLKKVIFENRSKFIDMSDFFELISRYDLQAYFPVIRTPAQLLSILNSIIDILFKNIPKYEPEKVALVELSDLIERLQDMQTQYKVFENIGALLKFFRRMNRELHVHFEGKPLSGYQIMGLLETRLLDFDRVFLLGMNEGILPKGKDTGSFIPYDIRKHFSMPVYDEKNAISAYHFYRLLSRAKQIWMLYDISTSGLVAGEPSRYILQLKEKLKNEHVDLKEMAIEENPRTISETEKISKDALFARKLLHYFHHHGVSASMIMSYKSYPVDFFRKYVLNWKDKPDLEDYIAANRMGDVVHRAFEEMYKPYENQVLTENILRKLIKEVDDRVTKIFFEEYLKIPYRKNFKLRGKNILALESAKQMVKKLLKMDLQEVRQGKELIILLTEKYLEITKEIPRIGSVKFKGFIDRIDRLDGQIRIVDYKTGSVDNLSISKDSNTGNYDFEKKFKKGNNKYQFQVYFYLWLLKNSDLLFADSEVNPIPVIYTVRKKGPVLHKEIDDSDNFLLQFEDYIYQLLHEMIDTERELNLKVK